MSNSLVECGGDFSATPIGLGRRGGGMLELVNAISLECIGARHGWTKESRGKVICISKLCAVFSRKCGYRQEKKCPAFPNKSAVGRRVRAPSSRCSHCRPHPRYNCGFQDDGLRIAFELWLAGPCEAGARCLADRQATFHKTHLQALDASIDPRLPALALPLLKDEDETVRRLAARTIGNGWRRIPDEQKLSPGDCRRPRFSCGMVFRFSDPMRRSWA